MTYAPDHRVEADAREYGEHIKHGGWRLALLVARNVELGTGQGARQPRDDRSEVESGKVSANEFAGLAGTSRPRVVRHFEAWEKAADRGHLPHASTLVPGQEVALPSAELWSQMYDATAAGGRPRDSKAEDAAAIITKRGVVAVISAMTEEQQREMYLALGRLMEELSTSSQNDPIRPEPTRLEHGIMMFAVLKAYQRIRGALAELREGDYQLDDDDQLRLHVLIERIREALDLLDHAAGGGFDDDALEAWLSSDVS